jgi:hypothetical protein
MPNYNARLTKLETQLTPPIETSYKIGIFEYDADNRSTGGTFDGPRFECHAGETCEAAAARHLASIGFDGNVLWIVPVHSQNARPVDDTDV